MKTRIQRAILSETFAKWQLPDKIIFVDEIPKTSVGKYDKKVLRIEYNDIYSNHGKSYLLNMVLSRLYKLSNHLEMGSEFDGRGWISVFVKAHISKKKDILYPCVY